jgi:molybdate transport system substrate-binding protein
MKPLVFALLAGALAIVAGGHAACAAEIKLLTAGAMRAVVVALLPDFEKQTGHKVTLDNATAGGLAKRIGEGEAFDVAIITPAVVDDLASKGKIVAGSRIDLAKVGMGVAIKEGVAVPDIGTVDAFKRMLLAAKSVAYIDPKAGGSSGIYFDKLLDRLGIGDQVRPKAKLKQGGYVAERWRAARLRSPSTRSARSCRSRALSWSARCRRTQNFTTYWQARRCQHTRPLGLIQFTPGPPGTDPEGEGHEKP